ncbi:MAG: helix-turn-helix domain-containing protein [Clostridiales bacterium]|nr:helix-turn-helix domain-containing protein [Clostridiales bacterium]MDD7387961.1 helix-turn-helix domain-containing protein [Bacillota bacterium]
MNTYVTGNTIRKLRENKHLTQSELGERIGVSDKAVSKWETGKGLPDLTLIQPLAQALDVSVIELMNGEQIINRNRSCNVIRSRLYVCPICGNVIHCTGDAVVSCCGVTLPPLDAEDPDAEHTLLIQRVEDAHFLTISHPMTKTHYISFMAFASSDRFQLVKLYPEGNAEARMQLHGHGILYFYCNRHGLMKKRL